MALHSIKGLFIMASWMWVLLNMCSMVRAKVITKRFIVSDDNLDGTPTSDNEDTYFGDYEKRNKGRYEDFLDYAALKRFSAPFRNDLGKRASFRSDLGKRDMPRYIEDDEENSYDLAQPLFSQVFEHDLLADKRARFRSDLGKRSEYATSIDSDDGLYDGIDSIGKFEKSDNLLELGKRLFRNDLGKRFRADLGKRDGSDSEMENFNFDLGKRFSSFRSDLGKRASFRSDLGKRGFRADLGKRPAFRADLGKRSVEE